MKNKSIPSFIFFVLAVCIFLGGCSQPQEISDTTHPENKTAVAIGIALNNSSVQTYLTDSWIITDVNFNATTSIAGGGYEDVTLRTPDVVFDSKSRTLHVYVDVESKSVINIWNSPKRVPYP